jgi:uncharacterized SAM-binding protein YcdF (DUF218 family)
VNLVPTRWYTSLFMPTTIAMALVAIGLWMVWRAMRSPSRGRMAGHGLGMAIVGLMLLYACCTPLVATWMARSLETQSVPISVADAPHVDAIVVLGGGIATLIRSEVKSYVFLYHGSFWFEG